WTHFNCRKPPVDEECAVRQNLQLFAASSTEFEKNLGILEVVVIRGSSLHFRSDDLAGLDRYTVVNGYYTNRVDWSHRQIGAANAGWRRGRDSLPAMSDHYGVESVDLGQLLLPVVVFVVAVFLDRTVINAILRDHHKQRGVDGKNPLAQNRALP